MSRCDYDAVFYRVFCVALLTVAFTFTLILTNVFIDIDGLLSKKHAKHKLVTEKAAVAEDVTMETASSNDINYGETDDSYRTKRSIETQNILLHIKSPKLKSILTSRLESLLDSLDAEETVYPIADKEKAMYKDVTRDTARNSESVLDVFKNEDNKSKRQKDDDLLHLTMHNILLQGIIGHMDLKEVYRRVGSLMLRLHNGREDNKENISNQRDYKLAESKFEKNLTKEITKEFVAEIFKCNELKNDNAENSDVIKVNFDSTLKSDSENQVTDIPEKIFQRREMEQRVKLSDIPIVVPIPLSDTPIIVPISVTDVPTIIPMTVSDVPSIMNHNNFSSGSNVLIKSTIEIKTSDNERNETFAAANIEGIVEIIFNGKSIRFSHPDDDVVTNSVKPLYDIMPKILPNKETTGSDIELSTISNHDFNNLSKEDLNKFVDEYVKQEDKTQIKNNLDTRRQKRHVKIKFKESKNKLLGSPKERTDINANKKKKDDDELYVEIETHFDSKGMKGEKKKKLIRSLVEKIQKAIHSEDSKQVTKSQTKQLQSKNTGIKKNLHEKMHVRKRIQNPLKQREGERFYSSVNSIIHRQLDPIIVSKTITSQNHPPNVRDKSGETWKKEYIGPAFLTASKSINSAEMSELDVDFSRVLDVNGIPQRLQKPLNTDMSEETLNANTFYDLGKMKFFIKDIDGSGFSVGYNQYVDEPPDTEAINLFTGLENVIKAYHDNYDPLTPDDADIIANQPDNEQDTSKNNHMIVRRSINEKHDYHSNEYKIIYDKEFLPYANYKDIYEGKSSKTDIESNKSPMVIDENIFEKNLKPAEIFSLANLLNRKKRSINVKKISNIKSKYKLNRYLNTKTMANKRIFLNNKRSKRQINKIRIIASDFPQKESSNENVFIVSDENMFADRAVIKEVSTPDGDTEKNEEPEVVPDQIDDMEYPSYKEFDGKYRNNPLMSKYPHIFLEEITRSREETDADNATAFHKMPAETDPQLIDTEKNTDEDTLTDATTSEPIPNEIHADFTEKSQQIQDIVDALQSPKSNYKVTVKIIPKNVTSGIHGHFKEIHTSINKRFNKNGLIYSSLVNMSEISKVTKVKKNKTIENQDHVNDYLSRKIKNHHDKMHLLLKARQKYIDEQLSRLHLEKTNIESLLIDDNNTILPPLDFLNMALPAKLHKVLRPSSDDIYDSFDANPPTIMTTMAPTTTITTTTTTTTTTPRIESSSVITTTTNIPSTQPPTLHDNIKKVILRKIERNEHLTDEILKKIDKNTEILQTFLIKLSDKVNIKKSQQESAKANKPESDPKDEVKIEQEIHKEHIQNTEQESHKVDINLADREPLKEEIKIEKPVAKLDVNVYPIDWRNRHMPLHPTVSFRKNESLKSVPFVYAYQQSLLPHKVNTPIASVAFHGHIHSMHKDVPPDNEKLRMAKALQITHQIVEREPRNSTRFFFDDVGNDGNVMSVPKIEYPLLTRRNGTMT